MKIIEAMKQVKDLLRKAEDIRKKIRQHCSQLSFEKPLYGDRAREQISEWLQAHEDLMQEVARLRVAIQRTNLRTKVAIELAGASPTKTIAEWIHRRRDLAKLDEEAWGGLTDKGLRESKVKASSGEVVDVSVVRNFDPVERDNKLDAYRSEPLQIDAALEVVNATTDIID